MLPVPSPRAWPEAVAAVLARCSFPRPGEPAACAVSGGPDSIALLALAVAAGCRAHAVHVDHGLRPSSATDADVVRDAAQALGATFETVTVVVGPGPDLEARARSARYEALPTGALVGHTADDQAETLLLNLMRGSGLDGLAAMRPGPAGLRGVRRPILDLRRSETAAVAAALGLRTVSDESNQDMRFRRNRVRSELLPMLADVSGRDPVPVLARTARLLAQDAEMLADLATGVDATDVRALRATPGPLARRALRSWLREGQGAEQHPPSAAETERVWQVVQGTAKACELAGGRRVTRSKGRLRVWAPAAGIGWQRP
jgi:tRNA(Ile)-lysidine synthase